MCGLAIFQSQQVGRGCLALQRGSVWPLAPPCAGTLGWAVSATLRFGNFWPIRPAPLGPGLPAVPPTQRGKQVPRGARRNGARDQEMQQGHHAPLSPSWLSAECAATPSLRPAVPRPRHMAAPRRRERLGKSQQHQQSGTTSMGAQRDGSLSQASL